MTPTESTKQFLAKPLPADIVALITSLSILEEARVKISEQFYIAFPDKDREDGDINSFWSDISKKEIADIYDRIVGIIEDLFTNHIYEDL